VATGTGGDDDAVASSGRPLATAIASTHTAHRRAADHHGRAALTASPARRDVRSTSIGTP